LRGYEKKRIFVAKKRAMKRKFPLLAPALAVMCLFTGCNAVKQLQSAYNLKYCEYRYHSISDLNLAGVNLSGGISALDAIRLTAILTGTASSIPLDFTLNINVHNPHSSQAAFRSMSYIIEIDGIEFTNGHMEHAFGVASGATEQLPIHIGVDLAKLATTHSKDALVRIVRNFAGLGNEETKVTVRLKPGFDAGGSTVVAPVYLPVSFSFGGKTKKT
jgi:LEA14-like dessication related protein